MRCYTIVKRVTGHCCTITYRRKIKRGVEKCAEENTGNGMKQQEVRKKLHSEKLHNLRSST